MKEKWYLSTWFIGCCYACWFLIIPLIVGIVLTLIRNKAELQSRMETASLCTDLEKANEKIKELDAQLTPEIKEANRAIAVVENMKKERNQLEQELESLSKETASKKKELSSITDTLTAESFGLYEPRYKFASALDYKEELAKIRALQKTLIKDKRAVTGNMLWQVNGNASKGKKMVSDTQKLLLRAFNSECDELIDKVKYNNFDASLDRIYKSSDAISKLGSIMNIKITQEYLSAKVKELRLAFEYAQKKEAEKEALKEARAEQKEQAKVQKELDEQRKKIEKEQTHYQTAYEHVIQQLNADPDNEDLQKKKNDMENQLNDIDKALNDIDYRQANAKAGYVYVISNIGAFGEDVYKIGMTRRLEPQERIDELGSASVPFNFDVHAMIFSDNAPALEAALHRAFEDKKVNMVNHRREFFHVTLDEIKKVIRENYDKTVEFVDVPDADQYRASVKIREEKMANFTTQ